MTKVCCFIFVLLAFVNLSRDAKAASDGLRGASNGHGLKVGIPQDALDKFKEKKFLRDDFDPSGQLVLDNRVTLGSETISVDDNDLDPFDVFTADANYFLGESKQGMPASSVFRSKVDPSVLVFKDDSGLRRVTKTDPAYGIPVSLEQLEDGSSIFVEIGSGDIDESKLKQFNYGEPPAPGMEYRLLQEVKERVASSDRFNRNLAVCSSYDIIKVAIAYESRFCSKSGGSQGAYNAVVDVVAQASIKYEELCAKVQISHLEGYCDSATDPYYNMFAGDICGTAGSVLTQFKDYWVRRRGKKLLKCLF